MAIISFLSGISFNLHFSPYSLLCEMFNLYCSNIECKSHKYIINIISENLLCFSRFLLYYYYYILILLPPSLKFIPLHFCSLSIQIFKCLKVFNLKKEKKICPVCYFVINSQPVIKIPSSFSKMILSLDPTLKILAHKVKNLQLFI